MERADPLVILHATIRRPAVRDVNVIGARPGGLGAPPLADGRAVARSGEVVADTELGLRPGDQIQLSGRQLQVVGRADQVTWYSGTPTLFLALEDAQAVAFDGQPLATAILTQGLPAPSCPAWRSRPPERFQYQPGQVVFEQGAPSDLVYVVEDGQVEIVRQRADGSDELVALLGPGRYFGEFGPLFGLRRSATARAVDHAVVTGYTPRDFRDMVVPAAAIKRASP